MKPKRKAKPQWLKKWIAEKKQVPQWQKDEERAAREHLRQIAREK